jgi:hypothetical protein
VYVNGVLTANPTSTNFRFNPRAGARDYTFTVTATNADGTSAASSPLVVNLGELMSTANFMIGGDPITLGSHLTHNYTGGQFALAFVTYNSAETLVTVDILWDSARIKTVNQTSGVLTTLGTSGLLTNIQAICSTPNGVAVIDTSNTLGAYIDLTSPTLAILNGNQALWVPPYAADVGGDGIGYGILYNAASGLIIDTVCATPDGMESYPPPALTNNLATITATATSGLGFTDTAGNIALKDSSILMADQVATGTIRVFDSTFAQVASGTLPGVPCPIYGLAVKSDGSIWTSDIPINSSSDVKGRKWWRVDGEQTLPVNTTLLGGSATSTGFLHFSGAGTINSESAATGLQGASIYAHAGVLVIAKGANTLTDDASTRYYEYPGATIIFTGWTPLGQRTALREIGMFGGAVTGLGRPIVG